MSKATKMGTIIIWVSIGIVILVFSSLMAVKVGHDFNDSTIAAIVTFIVVNALGWVICLILCEFLPEAFVQILEIRKRKKMKEEEHATEFTEEGENGYIEEEEPLKRFPQEYSDVDLFKIYYFLVNHRLISPQTNQETFFYWFGSDVKPNRIRRIEWLSTKQLLRETLTRMYKDKMRITDIEKLTPRSFSSKGKPLKLAKNKEYPSLKSHEIRNFFSDLLKSPATTNE